jgi:hypothetical protein
MSTHDNAADRFDDDLMDLADAVGVTNVDEPVPFVPAVFNDITDAVAHVQAKNRAKAVRDAAYDFLGREGDAWFAGLEVELLAADAVAEAAAEIDRRWFEGGGRS